MAETVFVGALGRYPDSFGFSTTRDPYDDLVLHLEFLTAMDSAAELLRAADDSETDIPARAGAVSSHARAARAFLEQANTSPETVAFVSAYYAALNLAKLCILFSPYHVDLPANRYHGVKYRPAPAPASLPDDRVEVTRGGAIPLLYRALTGVAIPAPIQISARDIYCLIADVAGEWSMATGGVSWMAELDFRTRSDEGGKRLEIHATSGLVDPLTIAQLPVLRRVQPIEGEPGHFLSDGARDEAAVRDLFEEVLDRRLLYYPHEGGARTAIGNLAGLPVVEELPLILAFYHLSSVARYNPEFLDSLRSSRYWPVAAALTRHGLYKFLLLSWCFIRRQHVSVTRV